MLPSPFTPPTFDPPKLSAWLAFSVAAHRDSALRAVNLATYESWRITLEQSARRYADEVGYPFDVERIADAVLALSDGLWLQHMLNPERMTPERASDICLVTLGDALQRPLNRA